MKIKILIPVYNDFQSVSKLINDINSEISNLNQETEILNFGVPGTTIVSHLDILRNLDGLGLDLIIVQFGDNDLIDLMTHHQEIFSRVKPTERPVEEHSFLKRIGKI